VDLSTDDPVAATASYEELLGWKCVRQSAREYWLCSLDGRDVGGIGPRRRGKPSSRWTTYLATDHLERTLGLVVAHGGRVISGPCDIEQHGRMALAADPGGATFGLWQAAEHIGTEHRTDPGSLVWSEALSHDFEAAKAFYVAVFGYEVEEIGGVGPRYAALFAGGRPVAGIAELHVRRAVPTVAADLRDERRRCGRCPRPGRRWWRGVRAVRHRLRPDGDPHRCGVRVVRGHPPGVIRSASWR
jgi:predicted enzyme related to lactoylglutathione lyase